jgi:hypothetical protein
MAEPDQRTWKIPCSNHKAGFVEVPLKSGDRIFIVGANGSGKSALIQHCVQSFGIGTRRISAHRQKWLGSSGGDLSPKTRKDWEGHAFGRDAEPSRRWMDDAAAHRLSITLFDLIAAENERARKIGHGTAQLGPGTQYARVSAPALWLSLRASATRGFCRRHAETRGHRSTIGIRRNCRVLLPASRGTSRLLVRCRHHARP